MIPVAPAVGAAEMPRGPVKPRTCGNHGKHCYNQTWVFVQRTKVRLDVDATRRRVRPAASRPRSIEDGVATRQIPGHVRRSGRRAGAGVGARCGGCRHPRDRAGRHRRVRLEAAPRRTIPRRGSARPPQRCPRMHRVTGPDPRLVRTRPPRPKPGTPKPGTPKPGTPKPGTPKPGTPTPSRKARPGLTRSRPKPLKSPSPPRPARWIAWRRNRRRPSGTGTRRPP